VRDGLRFFPFFSSIIILFGERRAGRPQAVLKTGRGLANGMADDDALAFRNATATRRHHRLESGKARPSGI
jgi:hypothetical protein